MLSIKDVVNSINKFNKELGIKPSGDAIAFIQDNVTFHLEIDKYDNSFIMLFAVIGKISDAAAEREQTVFSILKYNSSKESSNGYVSIAPATNNIIMQIKLDVDDIIDDSDLDDLVKNFITNCISQNNYILSEKELISK